MKFLGSFLLLFLISCSPTRPLADKSTNVTATFVTTKTLHHFHDASALAMDQFRNAYVVESSLNSVIKISPDGDSVREVSGFGSDHYQFNGPSGVDAHITNAIFISDRFNHRVEQYTKDLAYTGTIYTRENIDRSQRFGYPAAIAVDDGGNIYIADGENKRVIKARSDYSIERTIGGFSEATRPDAILSNPIALAIDKEERLIVLDNGGTSLVVFDNLGNFLARTSLEEKASSIASWEDEIYVLISDRAIVRLFQAPMLTEQGSWAIERTDSADTSPLEAFTAISGTGYLLSRQALYECEGVGKALIQQ